HRPEKQAHDERVHRPEHAMGQRRGQIIADERRRQEVFAPCERRAKPGWKRRLIHAQVTALGTGMAGFAPSRTVASMRRLAGRWCAMKRIVTLPRRRFTVAAIASAVSRSRLAVASSKMSRRGRRSSARAI